MGPRGVGRYARTDYDDLVSWARWMKGFRLMSTGARGKPAQQRACPVWGRDEDLVGKQLCVGNSRGSPRNRNRNRRALCSFARFLPISLMAA